jgi:flagellar biosynthesis protein FliQ
MSFADAIGLGREAIFVTLIVSAPVLILSMAVGLIVSIFQAVTQIQEPTLAFIPKILVAGLAILFFGPFMLAILTDFTSRIFANIAHIPIR